MTVGIVVTMAVMAAVAMDAIVVDTVLTTTLPVALPEPVSLPRRGP